MCILNTASQFSSLCVGSSCSRKGRCAYFIWPLSAHFRVFMYTLRCLWICIRVLLPNGYGHTLARTAGAADIEDLSRLHHYTSLKPKRDQNFCLHFVLGSAVQQCLTWGGSGIWYHPLCGSGESLVFRNRLENYLLRVNYSRVFQRRLLWYRCGITEATGNSFQFHGLDGFQRLPVGDEGSLGFWNIKLRRSSKL